ncbi:hypothetical protein P2G88_08610 [Aliiglaciecola sp. CAU 1673]|uniref:hypothetical protein n=1 Tax=Aliiglaciecola sp. CAU 1673 TaxID=3032595 RepID=UPI0023DB8503|nr:hypothetical protein [Aliiglaciecola sp. CAU 1673]MDF2178311.1 hypothetical protein [Aliiglaciecola sp. CAU 1673]
MQKQPVDAIESRLTRIEELLSNIEIAAGSGDLKQAATHQERFKKALEDFFPCLNEDSLTPALSKRLGEVQNRFNDLMMLLEGQQQGIKELLSQSERQKKASKQYKRYSHDDKKDK